VHVSWPGGQFASGQLDAAHPLVDEVMGAIRHTEHREARLAGAPYGSDLRLYAGMGGIPTLHYGPGDVRYAHAPREQVQIDELIATTRTLAVLAARRCGAHLQITSWRVSACVAGSMGSGARRARRERDVEKPRTVPNRL
jgi:acetylornithine deacetylase